jgi:hypothetical protein
MAAHIGRILYGSLELRKGISPGEVFGAQGMEEHAVE